MAGKTSSFNHQQSNGSEAPPPATACSLLGKFSNLTDGNVISDYLRQTVMAMYVQMPSNRHRM